MHELAGGLEHSAAAQASTTHAAAHATHATAHASHAATHTAHATHATAHASHATHHSSHTHAGLDRHDQVADGIDLGDKLLGGLLLAGDLQHFILDDIGQVQGSQQDPQHRTQRDAFEIEV